ncbi:unnamed protein product [Sphacelaria rigidula]
MVCASRQNSLFTHGYVDKKRFRRFLPAAARVANDCSSLDSIRSGARGAFFCRYNELPVYSMCVAVCVIHRPGRFQGLFIPIRRSHDGDVLCWPWGYSKFLPLRRVESGYKLGLV